MEIIQRFEVPHSGNTARPFCDYGLVVEEDGYCYLGLSFTGGHEYVYPQEPFNSPEEVIASTRGYGSMSHATSPNGPEYDGGRFGPGTYMRI